MINIPRSRTSAKMVNGKAAILIGVPISLSLIASGSPVSGSLVVGGFAGTFGGHLVRTAQILSDKPDKLFEMSRKILERVTRGKFSGAKLVLNSASTRAGIYIGLNGTSAALSIYALSQSKLIAGISAGVSATSAVLAGKEINSIGTRADNSYVNGFMDGATTIDTDQGPTFPDLN